MYTFCTSQNASGYCIGGTYPQGELIQGSDGNFYGTTNEGGANGGPYDIQGGTIFKISPSGALTALYNFCSQGGSACTDGELPVAGLVQGNDGNFYGTTGNGGIACPADPGTEPGTVPGCGTVYKVTPSGTYTLIHSFTGGSDGAFPNSKLVEGPDGNLYGTTSCCYTSSAQNLDVSGTVFKITPSGTLTTLYALPTIQAGGEPGGGSGFFLGSDGNFYGTDTYYDADEDSNPDISHTHGGVYKITSSGDATFLYGFLSYPDGSYPASAPVQGADGNIYGTTPFGGSPLDNGGSVYELAVSPSLQPPVSLTLSDQTTQPSQSVTLNWSVANAYSTTLQQCYAFVQGSPSGAGTWTGLQTGTFNAANNPPYSGSATITPTADGVYTYALTCGGMESGFATLVVGAPPTLTVTTTSLPAGQAGVAYAQTLQANGGVTPYTWSVSSGSLPAGTALSPTGIVSGTPTTAGASSFTVEVKDSESTPQTATASLTISISLSPLAISTTSLPGGSVGVAYSQTLQATGGIAPYTWNIASGALPPGISLSSTSGVISGTPTSAATFAFTVQAKDSESTPQTATAGLNIVVNSTTLAISSPSLPGATVGTAYSQTLQATGGVSPYTWSISAGSLPAGLTLATTGVISGTPSSAGTANFTVEVKDSESTPQTATANLSVTVNPVSLSITTTSLPNGTVGTAYLQTVQASGGVAPYSWSVSSGSLPAGLSVAATTGVISGTPTTAAKSSFTIGVKDSESTPETATASLTITISPTGLTITTSSLPAGTIGTAYSQTLQASGGVAPYTWSVSSGSLPAGLSLAASTGVISGSPTTAATSTFTVEVKDSESTPQTATASLSITVSPTGLTITTAGLPAATVGMAYSQTLQAGGGVAPYTWSVSAGSLPGGLSLAAGSGVISGTPTASGGSSFTIEVKDSESTPLTTTAKLSITVNPTALVVTTSSLPTGTVGTAYSQTLQASGGIAPYTWSVSSGTLPAGLSLATSTGVVSGTPTTAASANFTVEVKDSESTPETASASLSVTVNASVAPSFSLAASPTSLTIVAGQSGTSTITLTPAGGFSGTVNLSCSGLPQYSTCAFSPATLSPAGSNTALTTTLTMTTNVTTTSLLGDGFQRIPSAGSKMICAAAGLTSLVLCFGFRRRIFAASRFCSVLVLAIGLILACMGFISGCGGGSGNTGGSSTPTGPVTPAGNSTVTVTGSAGNGGAQETVNLTVTVTQ